MSDVAAKIKVMPSSPEIDLDDLEQSLETVAPAGMDVRGFEREDVAFGLVALLATVLVPDGEGGTEEVEDAFASLSEVESVEVLNVGRV